MQALLWRDYLCPWCYLGRDRTELLESLGVQVTTLGYELHPDVPGEGRAVRPDGRLATVIAGIGAECESLGMLFRAPSRIPNTRRALETIEVVRAQQRQAFAAVDDAFYRAVWIEDVDLGDPEVVEAALVAAGVDPVPIERSRKLGDGAAALEAAMAEAYDHDVTGTPAWWVDDRLLIPGVQDRATVERWVGRLLASRNTSPGGR
jgi:predicted DsbA family dithiol-disulfide isomerase